MGRWAYVTLLCGTLDILYAFTASAALKGRDPIAVLQGVATGPFGDAAASWGLGGAALGALTHYAIMAAMVAVGFALYARKPFTTMPWWLAGSIYGLALWFVMYGLVLPTRFGAPFPNPDPLALVVWGLPHWLCVAWPLAWLAGRASPNRSRAIS